MKLTIDTSSNEQTIIQLGEIKEKVDSSMWKSQVVLPEIEKLLAQNKKKVTDITEIEVATGPGSYTGLKVGVAIANALGWALKVPVNGKMINATSIVELHYD